MQSKISSIHLNSIYVTSKGTIKMVFGDLFATNIDCSSNIPPLISMSPKGETSASISDMEKAECLNDFFASISSVNEELAFLPLFTEKKKIIIFLKSQFLSQKLKTSSDALTQKRPAGQTLSIIEFL